jgi:hypothetical protein
MRNPIPPIPEAVAALKERLQHIHDGHQQPRLQMLYLLAGGQARILTVTYSGIPGA